MGTQRYWAFLSYSHADEAQAKRLHVLLERYVLPGKARKAHGLPRRLFPIFRDVEELEAASGLTTRLRDALNDSRWLVVLCSPNSAKSKYVNEEVEYFLGKHGPERILCVLLGGEPPECFPPAIRALKEEPLAADCRAGHDTGIARLKLIAAIAGIGFTELRDREAQRRRLLRMSFAAACATAALGALAYWDLLVREQVDHYVGYVRVNGIWQGVDRISAEQASHRDFSYRFLRHGRLHAPERVDYINSSSGCWVLNSSLDPMQDLLGDNPVEGPLGGQEPILGYCSAHFVYSNDGGLREETLYNGLDIPKFSLLYTSPTLAQITRAGFAATASDSGIRYVQFERDAQGYDRQRRFFYDASQPRRNKEGAYGYRYAYDEAGRVSLIERLNSSGEPTGIVERRVYSSAGFMVDQRNEDGAGKLRVGAGGYAGVRRESDAYGNVIAQTLYSGTGAIISTQPTSAIVRFSYDEHGWLIRACNFDADGRPATIDDIHCGQHVHDARGRDIYTALIGLDGKIVHGQSAMVVETDYNDRGLTTETRFFDDRHQPSEAWGAVQRSLRDAQGRLAALQVYDGAGHREMTGLGTGVALSYDSRDNIVARIALDADDRPTLATAWGYAGARYEVDEHGNRTATHYLDSKLQPMLRLPNNGISSRSGYASVASRYDGNGNEVERRFLDTRGRLASTSDGIALQRRHYDNRGLIVEERFYDSQEHPVTGADGSYGYRQGYDANDHPIEKTYLDAAGQPGPSRAGYSKVRYRDLQFDLTGLNANQEAPFAKATYFDTQEQVVGQETRAYNLNATLTEKRYFDARHQPAPSPLTGCAVERHVYDARLSWMLSSEHCEDAAGRPVNRKDGGWATRRITLEHTHIVSDEYFDAAGRPVKPPQ